jgi:hypothetical protein
MEAEGSGPYSQDPLLVPILSHMNSVHSSPPYLSKIDSNVIFLALLSRLFIRSLLITWHLFQE